MQKGKINPTKSNPQKIRFRSFNFGTGPRRLGHELGYEVICVSPREYHAGNKPRGRASCLHDCSAFLCPKEIDQQIED